MTVHFSLTRVDTGVVVAQETYSDAGRAAFTKFAQLVAGMSLPPGDKQYQARARLGLSQGNVWAETDVVLGANNAVEALAEILEEYGAGPGWGGPSG